MTMIFSLVLTTLMFSTFALWTAVYALIQVEAFRRSTHQVTFLNPAQQMFEQISEETKKAFAKPPETYDTLM